MAKGNIFYSSFYCPACGEKVMELPRKRSSQKERFHRKKLTCFGCKKTLNCVEIRYYEDEIQFKEDFAAGLYKEEVERELQKNFVPTGLML